MRGLRDFPEGNVQGRGLLDIVELVVLFVGFLLISFHILQRIISQSFAQISLAISKSETRKKMAVKEK